MGFCVRQLNLKIISIYYQYPRAGTIFISQEYLKTTIYLSIYAASQDYVQILPFTWSFLINLIGL